MKISITEIKYMTDNIERIERFEKLIGSENVDIENYIDSESNIGDLMWLAGEKISLESIVLFACDCASINLVQIERYCNSAQYEKIDLFINNPFSHEVDVTKEVTRQADADVSKKMRSAFGKDENDPLKIEADEANRAVAALWSANAAIKASNSNNPQQAAKRAARAVRAAKSAGYAKLITICLVNLFKGTY